MFMYVHMYVCVFVEAQHNDAVVPAVGHLPMAEHAGQFPW